MRTKIDLRSIPITLQTELFMNNLRHLFAGILLTCSFLANGQSYTFSVANDAYVSLTDSLSTNLNNGMIWDDPTFEIPIGFDFQFFDITFSTIYLNEIGVGGFLSSTSDDRGVHPLLIAYGADIVDRGADFSGNNPSPASLSPISYLLEGAPGSRILKLEWENVGFYSDLSDDNVSTDFINFQLWLYEGSNTIELRVGSTSVQNPLLAYDGDPGPFVGIVEAYNFDTDELAGEAYLLSGAAANPTLQPFTSIDDFVTMTGSIPEGTVYRFTRAGGSSSASTVAQHLDITVFPNPAAEMLSISSTNHHFSITGLSVINANGQEVLRVNDLSPQVHLSGLAAGMYLLKIDTNEGVVYKEFMKS